MAPHTDPPYESYTIRRKIFKILGAAFHIYDREGGLVGYCRQKAFRLREDIRIYTDESCAVEFITIRARSIIDFSATYDVMLADGSNIGSLRRRGLSSAFVRDAWQVFAPDGRHIADLREDGGVLPLLRRHVDAVSLISPQRYSLLRADGDAPDAAPESPAAAGAPGTPGVAIARYRQHFNPFVYRLGIAVLRDDAEIDDLLILAAGCLIAAVEGRQD